jgi:serine/threonine protein kinase
MYTGRVKDLSGRLWLSDLGTHVERLWMVSTAIFSTVPCPDRSSGSTFYLSPECQGGIFDRIESYDTAGTDIWSLGVILVNMTCGRNPWRQACSSDETFRAFVHNPEFLRTILPISHATNNILKGLFALDPQKRTPLRDLRAQILAVDTFTMTEDELRTAHSAARAAAAAVRPVPPPTPTPQSFPETVYNAMDIDETYSGDSVTVITPPTEIKEQSWSTCLVDQVYPVPIHFEVSQHPNRLAVTQPPPAYPGTPLMPKTTIPIHIETFEDAPPINLTSPRSSSSGDGSASFPSTPDFGPVNKHTMRLRPAQCPANGLNVQWDMRADTKNERPSALCVDVNHGGISQPLSPVSDDFMI